MVSILSRVFLFLYSTLMRSDLEYKSSPGVSSTRKTQNSWNWIQRRGTEVVRGLDTLSVTEDKALEAFYLKKKFLGKIIAAFHH